MLKQMFVIGGLLLTGVTAMAAPVAKPDAPLVCPVTGEKIASVKAAAGHSVYQGKTYYFCCSDCKPQFDKNPAKYVKPAATPAAH